MMLNKTDEMEPWIPEDSIYGQIWFAIKADGYVPETSMDNLVIMVLLHFENELDQYDSDVDYGDEFTIDGCRAFVYDNNGWKEFDYYC